MWRTARANSEIGTICSWMHRNVVCMSGFLALIIHMAVESAASISTARRGHVNYTCGFQVAINI